MIEAEPHEYALLLKNRSLLEQVVPHFNALMQFAEGRIKTFEFTRTARQLEGKKGLSKNAWAVKYSYEDAHKIAGGITRSFQTYWQSECNSMKTQLLDMDKHHTGRVPL